MKKNLKNDKLSLNQNTIRRLTDERLAQTAGASWSGCLYLTKPTTVTNGCQ
jgi:hypothetical protein